MWVCKECAAKTGWTYHIVVSIGPCELCELTRPCDDIRPMGRPALAGSLEQIRQERDERRAKQQ